MRPYATSALALLVAAAGTTPSFARAACPANVMYGAAAAHANAEAINRASGVFLKAIPSTFAFPDTVVNVQTCTTGGNGTVGVTFGQVQVAAQNPQVSFQPGAVTLGAVFNVSATATVNVALCDETPIVCQAQLVANNVQFSAQATGTVNDCSPVIGLPSVSLVADPYGLSINLTNCGLIGQGVDLIANAYQSLMLQFVSSEVTTIAQQKVPDMLSSVTGNMFATELSTLGLHLELAIDGLQIDSSGLTVDFAIGVTPTGPAAECLPAGSTLPVLPPTTAPLTADFGNVPTLSGAFSTTLLQQVVDVAWYSGLLCFDSAKLGLDLSSYAASVAPGMTIDAIAVPQTAPQLSLGSASGGALVQVRLDQVVVDLNLGFADGTSSQSVVTAGATIAAQVVFDPFARALMIEPVSAVIDNLNVTTPGGNYQLSQDALERIVKQMVMPALTSKLKALPIVGDVFLASGLAVCLIDVAAAPGYARADIDVWLPDPNDMTAPTTVLGSAPPSLVTPTFTVDVASTDNETPQEFMRHQVSVDGVPSTTYTSGALILVSVGLPGSHSVAIQAVDLTGNVDPVGVKFDVFVDNQAPVVTLVSSPLGILSDTATTIQFSATDDYTTTSDLRYRYTVGVIQDSTSPDIALFAGATDSSTSVALTNLPSGQTIRVAIFAKDAAGNEASLATAFRVQPDSGLSCTQSSPAPWAALLGLALMVTRRRGRGRNI